MALGAVPAGARGSSGTPWPSTTTVVAAQGLASPLDQADAASLLWRLWLHGADIGGRPRALADAFEASLSDSAHCFNDWHAVMALGLAGRLGTAYGLLAELTYPGQRHQQSHAGPGRGRRDLGRPGLRPAVIRVRRESCSARPGGTPHVFGGSHAQRDAIDLTLLAAAAASGDDDLVRALMAERVARKPTAERAARLVIEASQARAARPGSVQHRAALNGPRWGGWGSNPRPADYESAALTG